MRRDPDLIRQLMLDIEAATQVVSAGHHQADNYSQAQVAAHMAMIVDAGLASGQVMYSHMGGDPNIPAAVMIKRLTPAGHDFIDNLRSDTVWQKVKGKLASAGGTVSIELMKQLGIGVMKQHLGLP